MSKILQTPSISSIQAFDPSFDKEIYFTYTDNQAVKNRAVITDNTDNTIVYDVTQDNMRLYHVIPANILELGKKYLIQIQVFDADGNASNLSEAVLMYCYTTPSFYFSNIVDSQEYKNANIQLELQYEQLEGEELKNFQFLQYSYDKTLLSKSNVYYSSSTLNYTFSELENNNTYYFRAIGETNHGMQLDTGYVCVNTSYATIPMDVLFSLENHRCDGYIYIQMNIKDVGYIVENDNYVFSDGLLTLTNNSLTYNDGFEADGDFVLLVETKSLPLKKFLTTNDDSFYLEIVKICNQYYCCLYVKDTNIMQYVALSKATNTDDYVGFDDDLAIFEVKRVNGIYSLNMSYKSEMTN